MKRLLSVLILAAIGSVVYGQMGAVGGGLGGGGTITFAAPYICQSGTCYDTNFNQVTKPLAFSGLTSIDDPADVSGKYAWADATHAATGLLPGSAPIGATNGDILLTAPVTSGHNEVDLHFLKHFSSPQPTVTQEFSLNASSTWLSHSANGGLIVTDCVNHLMVLYQIYGNGGGPLELVVSVLDATFGSLTCGVGPYGKATYWGNVPCSPPGPPTCPYYGGSSAVYPLQQPKLSNINLRIRVGTYQSQPAWFFDYSADGGAWVTPLSLCGPTTSGCPMDYPAIGTGHGTGTIGNITDAGPEYYSGDAATNAAGGSIFRLISTDYLP